MENAIATKSAARKKPRILSIESGHFVDPCKLRLLPSEQSEQRNVVVPEIVDLTADDSELIELIENDSIDDASPLTTSNSSNHNVNSPDIELIDLTEDASSNLNYNSRDNQRFDEERYTLYYEEPSEPLELLTPPQFEVTEWFTRIDTYARTVFSGTRNS